MAIVAFAAVVSSDPAALVFVACLAFVWLAVVLTLQFAAGRLSMPAVAVLGMLGAIGLAVFILWAAVDGGQP